MEVHATPSPLNTRHRIHNRPTDKTEVRLFQAEEAMRKTLRRLRRSDKEQYAIIWKWRDFSRIMLQTHPCMTIRRRKRALAFWYSMSRRLVRRSAEQSCVYHMRAMVRKRAVAFWYSMGRRLVRRSAEQSCVYHMRALVEAWVPIRVTRPKSWSKRGPLRCPICIFDYFQASEPRERRQKKNAAYRLYEGRAHCASMSMHMEHKHDDLGRSRICVKCGKICASEGGAFQHQIIKHLNVRPRDICHWT